MKIKKAVRVPKKQDVINSMPVAYKGEKSKLVLTLDSKFEKGELLYEGDYLPDVIFHMLVQDCSLQGSSYVGVTSCSLDNGVASMHSLLSMGISYEDKGAEKLVSVIESLHFEKGKLTAVFNPEVRPHYLSENRVLLIPHVKGTCSYSLAFAKYLKGKEGKIELDFDVMKSLGLPVSYLKIYSEFRRKVFDRLVSEINSSDEDITILSYGKTVTNGRYAGVWLNVKER